MSDLNWTEIILGMLTACTVVMQIILQRNQTRSDRRAEARRQESLLALQMQNANGKLTYATAMAVKRGHANGEMDDALGDYTACRKKYYDFMNEQAIDGLQQ